MRRSFSSIPILACGASLLAGLALFACDDHGHHGRFEDNANEIVFGIRQAVGTDGTTTVSAEYEFLSLAHQGGWVTQVFHDGDDNGVCYFELFDHRIGKPHVESGAASFTGGKLPTNGIAILANQPDPSLANTTGWATGDTLSFQVTGFAMPNIRPITMSAPPTDLTIGAIAPAPADNASSVAIKPTDDVSVTWTPPTDDPHGTHVMLSLVTDDANGPAGEVRCFSRSDTGSLKIPSLWVAKLFSSVTSSPPTDAGTPTIDAAIGDASTSPASDASTADASTTDADAGTDATAPAPSTSTSTPSAAAITGHLNIASHHQSTIRARGDWLVYVVATSLHKDIPFTAAP